MIGRIKNFIRRYLQGQASYKFFIRHAFVPNDMAAAVDVLSTMRHVRAIEPVSMQVPKAERVVVIAPHPDDEIIGPGGTLINLLDGGSQIRVVYLTDGDHGSDLAARRRAEAKMVSDNLGFETVFLGLEPGNIALDATAHNALSDAIRQFGAQAIFVPFLLDDHPDHRRAAQLLAATIEARQLGMQAEVWSYQVYTPLPGNVVVDISDVAERKAEAIRMFASQMETRDWAHYALGLNAFNLRLLPSTNSAAYAEAFFVLPPAEYVILCRHYFDGNNDA